MFSDWKLKTVKSEHAKTFWTCVCSLLDLPGLYFIEKTSLASGRAKYTCLAEKHDKDVEGNNNYNQKVKLPIRFTHKCIAEEAIHDEFPKSFIALPFEV